MTDPIADMLTRIRNASKINHKQVLVPFSQLKEKIARILEKESLVDKVEIIPADKDQKGDARFPRLRILLKYTDSKSRITSLKRISKPGLRKYASKDDMPRILNGKGIAIVSTSSGLLTNRQARKAKIGGEVICEIY